MGNTPIFMGIIMFMLFFNMLLGYYSITEASETDIIIPEFPDEPSVVDYVLIPFQYIGVFFQLVFFSIFGLPPALSVFIIALNITLGFILVKLARGGG